MVERPLYTLYKGLKANNYDVPESYDSFEKTLVEAGNGGANSRHTLYNNLKSQGYDVPDTYESFYRTLFTPVNKTTSRAIGGEVPMSDADKRRFSAGAANISYQAGQTMRNAGRYNKLKERQKKQKTDFGRVNIGTHKTPYGGDAENVVKDDFAFNPETGKAGTYVNSDSEDAYGLAEAEQKQAALDKQSQAYQEAVNAGDIPSVFDVRDKNGNYDLQENVGKDGTNVTEEGLQAQYEKKLADAYARKKELEGMIAADNEKNGNPLLSYSAAMGAGSGASEDRRMMISALNLVNAEIGSLEAVTQTGNNAWYQDMMKAMDNTAFNAKTWDFGISDFAMMGQLERIKAKMDQNIPLNGMEKTLLKSKVGADAAAALEDDKMGAAYRWTKIAGQSLPFMADFFLTGGYGGITKATSRAALKFAAKNGMGKLGTAILKNTGVVGADIIGSYAMAGTEQAMKTGADIMQRHMGNLYQDEEGNYKFGTFDEDGNLLHEGGESMGKALYKGMTAAMLENYTEKIFGHNYGLKKGALKFMENHGMARSAELFKNIGSKEWYAGSKKWMEKFGINGFAEEVMEEEINIPLNALLVGDNKMSDILDPKQQMDIIGGMALSVGSMYAMGAGTRPFKGVYNRAQYYRYKSKVNNSDSDAYSAFGGDGSDKWEALRDKIDNTPNEKMGGVLASIIASRDELSKDQIDAAVHYGVNLMKMRGYNLAKTEEMNAKEMTGEPTTPEEQHDEEVENAYSEGQEAEDSDKHNIQLEQQDQMTTLAGLLGITEQQLSGMTDEELESLTGQDDKLDQAIYDYQLSTARYQGVMDKAQDSIDMAAQQAAHETDMLTDKSRGTVRNATVIGINGEEDYGVYIINGKLATHEDGAINISGSDDMILYYDPKTKKVEHADARRFVALGEELPAEEVKAQAIADAKEAAIKAEAGIIDGAVEVGTMFSTTDADGTEHTYEVLADNGDGTAMITIDGNVEQNPYSFEQLQNLKDAEDLKRLNAAKIQRGLMEEQKKQEEEQQQQTPDIDFDAITNNEGNVVVVDVLNKDGNTRYPGSQVFLISEDGKMAKVMETDKEGNLKPHAVDKKDIVKTAAMSLDEFKQTLPSSNIEEDRGEIEVEEPTESEAASTPVPSSPLLDAVRTLYIKGKEAAAKLFKQTFFDVVKTPAFMKKLGLTGDKFTIRYGVIARHFGKDGQHDFPIDVWEQLANALQNPLVISKHFEKKVDKDGHESLVQKGYRLYTALQLEDGSYITIGVTVKNAGRNLEVNAIDTVFGRDKISDEQDEVIYTNKEMTPEQEALLNGHNPHQYQPAQESGITTNPTSASHGASESELAALNDSEGKGNNNSAENNENNETLTLEDGTVVPMMEDGNPDFSQLTAEQTAELYDTQFGEDAEQIISGFVSEAKKALDKANNMTVKGKNFAEQKASKAEKDKAIAEAQTAYDSAKAISDAYAERQLTKELDTHEGRMNLIQKAKNKYNRLKNKEEWKNNPYALWNETIGKVLHRLYDGLSVDVFDHEPQTVEEYVSSNISPYSLNFEGKENSKGVAAETGLQRKDFAKSRVLAAEGKGKTVDEFVQKLWDARPQHLENVSDQEIRNALLGLITSDMNAYDMSHVIEDNRIAQAEEELENEKAAAENAAAEEEQRKQAEEEAKKQAEAEAKKQAEAEATAKEEEVAKKQAAANAEEVSENAAEPEDKGKLDEEMADANEEYEHLAPSYNFENDENLSEEEREAMVLRDGETFDEYYKRNGGSFVSPRTPLDINIMKAYIQQKYGENLAQIDAIFAMPMRDHYDGWRMAEEMMKIVDANFDDFNAALYMRNDNVKLSSDATLGYLDGAAELIKARRDAEKLGLPAFDSEGTPVIKYVIDLANWAKEQGLEVDGESAATNYANLYVACKDGFGATTLVPDQGENINMVFYFPTQLMGENGEVNHERLRQMADEFNEGRDAKHSAETDIELTDGAQFYDGDTAREFRDFVDQKVEEENKPFGEQINESDLPFSVKEGKGEAQYNRAEDVEKNRVDNSQVVDDVVGKKTRKAFDRLAKMMGAKIQWQYSDKMGNGWYDEKVNEDGSVERTIYITLDSSIMEGAQFIFGHEMTHEIKSKNPAAFEELKNLIINTYGKETFEKAVDETEKRYRKEGVNYAGGRAAYEEEVVADGIGEMIRDLNLAHTLALKMSHPLLATLHEILMKIKRAFYGTEYSDSVKEVIRGIEQAYLKAANGSFESEDGENREEVAFSLRQKEEPKKKGIGYKVFLLGKDGKLYPPMVANPNGTATPVGVWLDADAAPIAGESKTGRPQVKQGGKGTQGGSGKLAYRPGWHLGVIPYALQFNRKDAEGNKTLFPKNFVFAEVEYAADVDYQQEAHDAGVNPSGKYQHSLAGLKHLPTDGYYMYRTNPNPETDPWVITGAMKVNRILTRAEQADLVKKAGREPQMIQEGDIVTDEVVNAINQEIANAPKFSLKVYHGSGADFTEFDFDHMGEGAGSQAFGWGGYVTSSEEIGKSYARNSSNKSNSYKYAGKEPLSKKEQDVLSRLVYDGRNSGKSIKQLLEERAEHDNYLKEKYEGKELNPLTRRVFESAKIRKGLLSKADKLSSNDVVWQGRNFYEVEIPENNGKNYLDWYADAPKDLVDKVKQDLGISDKDAEHVMAQYDGSGQGLYRLVSMFSGNTRMGSDKEASKYLSSLGYTGIKYPAGTIMGGAEEGDMNYVIFKPEDMKITEHTKFSIKTYHGSQASFDHFDHSFMGSGEGAQAYGWGTYVSEVEGIARAYAKQNARKHSNGKGSDLHARLSDAEFNRTLLDTRYNHVVNDIDFQTKNREKKKAILEEELKDRPRLAETYGEESDIVKDSDKIISHLQRIVERSEKTLVELAKRKKELEKDLADSDKELADLKAQLEENGEFPWRNLYTVEIPDDTGDNYISWDGKVSENAAANIAKGIVAKDIDVAIDLFGKYGNFIVDADVKKLHDRKDEIIKEKLAEKLSKAIAGYRGGAVYDDLAKILGGQKEASLFLKDAGFDGVKVIAQRNSGGNKQGNMNYVIFDENKAQIVNHEKFSLKNAKPVRFEVGKSLNENEKKEVLATLKDAYKENNVPFHVEESANGKERRVYEPKAEDYVKSDITGRALRYYITLPDGRVAHPTEVYPNISNNEVETSLKKRDVLSDEVKGLIDGNVNKLRDSVSDQGKAVAILKQLQDLEHDTTDVGYGLENPQSFNYKTGVFTSNADQAIDYVARRMRRKEDIPSDVVDAVKAAVKNSYGMVDNLLDGLADSDAPKTFEEFLDSPSLKFQIKNEEQRKAAENAYNWAAENRPDKWKQYALVNMERPNQMPEYYEKKKLADQWRRYENKVGVKTDFKLFDLNKPFEENVVNVKGKVPEEFNPLKDDTNKEVIAERKKIKAERLELGVQYRELGEKREKMMQDALKKYMEDNGINSESEVPMDVMSKIRRDGFDFVEKEVEKLKDKYLELGRREKALGGDLRYSLKSDELKKAQLEIINKTNPMLDDYHTGIRKVEDIKTFLEAYELAKTERDKYGDEQMSSYPDETDDILDDALENGKITIYSSKPIKNGAFVTPSRMQAEDYAGGGKVYEKTVPVDDVAWIDVEQGQYAKVSDDIKFSIRTYHGTGAKFDNFDLSHALEGEGSETFGHGVYVTNSEKIGESYAGFAKSRQEDKLRQNVSVPDSFKAIEVGAPWYRNFVRIAGKDGFKEAKDATLYDMDKGIEEAQATIKKSKRGSWQSELAKDRLSDYTKLKELFSKLEEKDLPEMEKANAYRYEVEIPDDDGTNYLTWNESINNIPLEKWAEMYDLLTSGGYLDAGINPKDQIYRIIDIKLDTPEDAPFQRLSTLKGEELYHALEDFYNREEPGFGAERASECLSKLGFVGIKYPAGMIHGGAKEGDYNYVIFKESDAKIVGNTKYSLKYNQFEHDLEQWKKDNNLPKDAQRPTIPQREPGESAVDFMNRVKEYRKEMALWATAPTYEGHLLTDDTALGEFNRELQRGSVLKRIAFQDSMLAIRKVQEAIMKEHGVDSISMAEDAYTAENRSHGKGKNELEEYNDEFLQPLRKAYKKMKDLMDGSYDNVKVYMMAKHGLERNAQIAFRDALKEDYEDEAQRMAAYNGYKTDVARMQNDADLAGGRVDYGTWRQRDNAIRAKYAPSFMDFRYDKNGIVMDYSGLTALFEGANDMEVAAYDLVKNAEDKYGKETKELWDATNAATKKILRDSYKAGMMSKEVYEYVRDMYRNYIPLRGWNGTQADQVWDYIGGGKGAFNQALKTANGRTSIADDPIAYIENMAESGILINNKNWVKQHLMMLAQNHPTSLLTLSKAWYVKSTDAAGNETWIPASPQITSGMSGQQVEAAVEAFEKKMEAMAQNGDATQQRGHLDITYPQTASEEREHEVRVMKDGEEYVIYVNGDPQLAQAMNNTRAHRVREIQSGKIDRMCAWVGRKMAAAYTSLSPLFIPSNYFRDLTMTLASTAIREDGRYNYLLRKNLATSWGMWGLLKDYRNGTLREKVRSGNATEKEQMFYDFMMNGGETGFVSSFDVEDLKKKFKNDLKDMDRWAVNPKKVLHTVYDGIEFMNRAIENSNRFAIYMTSIQYGRSIEEAVNNAKDVTLNFNRKGTGEYGWQMIRNLYLFINPAVQSLQTLGALAKHHPVKFTAVTSAWLVSGALVPLINEGLMLWANMLANAFGGDDDDEYKNIKEKYWQFSKWDRRNNMILWVPFTNEFVKIPLAQEFRGFYAVGDMIASKLLGGDTAKESWSEYAEDLMGQVVDMLPLDPTGYDGNIAVSLMPNAVRPLFELAFNVDFTGKPLFKDSEYNKYDPNFTKAYAGTPDWLVRVSKMVNSVGNDYPDVQQNSIDALGDPRFNLNNPAVVDHVLSSYLGGAYTMGSQVLGVLTKALNDPKEIKMADIPLFSKFVSNPDDRPVSKKQGDEFWTMKENHDRAANTLSKLKKQAKVDGDYNLLEQFYGSEEYKQYKLDDAKVKKYQEDKKKEKAAETGEEYKAHQRTADDVYQDHATAKDDFEDVKMRQIYTKLNGFKTSYDLLVKLAPSQSDDYYQKHKVAIDAINTVNNDRQDISDLKKGFLTDGVVSYNAEDMKKIRELRAKVLEVLDKANKEVIAQQKEEKEQAEKQKK